MKANRPEKVAEKSVRGKRWKGSGLVLPATELLGTRSSSGRHSLRTNSLGTSRLEKGRGQEKGSVDAPSARISHVITGGNGLLARKQSRIEERVGC